MFSNTYPIQERIALNRKCKHCGKPIPFNEHLNREFCEPSVNPNGSINSCKDDYHTQLNRVRYEPFNNIKEHHKKTHENIVALLARKGDEVMLKDLIEYEIDLHRPFEIDKDEDGHLVFRFVQYQFSLIKEDPFTYKITEHEIQI